MPSFSSLLRMPTTRASNTQGATPNPDVNPNVKSENVGQQAIVEEEESEKEEVDEEQTPKASTSDSHDSPGHADDEVPAPSSSSFVTIGAASIGVRATTSDGPLRAPKTPKTPKPTKSFAGFSASLSIPDLKRNMSFMPSKSATRKPSAFANLPPMPSLPKSAAATLKPLGFNRSKSKSPRPPLLTLHSANTTPTPSLLASTLFASESEDVDPLYSIDTTENESVLMRRDVRVASFVWPKLENDGFELDLTGETPENDQENDQEPVEQDVKVDFAGRTWLGGELLVRSGKGTSASRKFTVPNFPHALKWKSNSPTNWVCTATSVTGAIATLATPSPFLTTPRIKLTIYESPIPEAIGDETLETLENTAVNIQLLDYILVTCVLLATLPDDWKEYGRKEEELLPPARPRPPRAAESSTSLVLQLDDSTGAGAWRTPEAKVRKGMFREALVKARNKAKEVGDDVSRGRNRLSRGLRRERDRDKDGGDDTLASPFARFGRPLSINLSKASLSPTSTSPQTAIPGNFGTAASIRSGSRISIGRKKDRPRSMPPATPIDSPPPQLPLVPSSSSAVTVGESTTLALSPVRKANDVDKGVEVSGGQPQTPPVPVHTRSKSHNALYGQALNANGSSSTLPSVEDSILSQGSGGSPLLTATQATTFTTPSIPRTHAPSRAIPVIPPEPLHLQIDGQPETNQIPTPPQSFTPPTPDGPQARSQSPPPTLPPVLPPINIMPLRISTLNPRVRSMSVHSTSSSLSAGSSGLVGRSAFGNPRTLPQPENSSPPITNAAFNRSDLAPIQTDITAGSSLMNPPQEEEDLEEVMNKSMQSSVRIVSKAPRLSMAMEATSPFNLSPDTAFGFGENSALPRRPPSMAVTSSPFMGYTRPRPPSVASSSQSVVDIDMERRWEVEKERLREFEQRAREAEEDQAREAEAARRLQLQLEQERESAGVLERSYSGRSTADPSNGGRPSRSIRPLPRPPSAPGGAPPSMHMSSMSVTLPQDFVNPAPSPEPVPAAPVHHSPTVSEFGERRLPKPPPLGRTQTANAVLGSVGGPRAEPVKGRKRSLPAPPGMSPATMFGGADGVPPVPAVGSQVYMSLEPPPAYER